MKQIVIKISSNGLIQAETVNMKGKECQKYISNLEELTSSVSVDSKYKDSFYRNVEDIESEENVNMDDAIVSNKMKL